jgi:hypothetical protein
MAITIGNKTDTNPTPNATSSTISHNQNTGSNGFLYVEIAMSSTWTCTGVTYNGVAMTQLDTNNVAGSINVRHYRFYLANPATGANNLVVSYSGTYTTSIGIYAQSLTGCSGIAASDWTALANAPHADTMSVTAGSVLFGSGISLYTISTVNVAGVNYFSPNFTTNASVEGDRYTGQISGALSAGTSNYTNDTGAPSFQVTNHWVLFGEAAAPPATRRKIWIV